MEQEVREVQPINTDSVNEFQPNNGLATASGNLAVEQSRSAQEVMGAIISAKRFPRDTFTAFNNILKDCERYGLAEKAKYSYPRGGQQVTGVSIRLAEAIAQRWGNIDCGIREIERKDGKSIMQAYAWDLETNYRVTRNFTVEHIRDTRKGSYRLTDQRDIYERTANDGARRMRACILEIIPGDVVEAADKKVNETLARGPKGVSKEDRLRTMVVQFDKVGVPKDAIEKRLGHSIKNIVDEEIVDLIGVYNAIKDNVGKRDQFFDLGEAQTESAKKLTDKLKNESKDKEPDIFNKQ